MSHGQDKFAAWALAWSKIMVMCWSDDQFRTDLFNADAEKTREIFRKMGFEASTLMELTVRTMVPEEVYRNPELQPNAADNWKLAKVKVEMMLPPPPPKGMRAFAVLDYLKAEAEAVACFCCC